MNTAAPMPADTPITRGTLPCGLSCRAVAPAMAALPPAATAALVEPHVSPTAIASRTPSRLRATSPTNGHADRRAEPVNMQRIIPWRALIRLAWVTLTVADENRVRTLTLNRPEALNAFNEALYDAATVALREAAADPAVA